MSTQGKCLVAGLLALVLFGWMVQIFGADTRRYLKIERM